MGQSPGLVCVELRGATHRLARLQAAHQVLVRHHLAHREREAERDGQGETLRDGDHDDGDGVDQVVKDQDPVPTLALGPVDDPADHGRDERGDRGADAKVTDGHHQHVETILERGRARLDDERLQDDAPLRRRADGDDHHAAGSLGDCRPGQEERILVVGLGDADGLAGHRGLVGAQLAALEEYAVGGDLVARAELDYVAHQNLACGHRVHLTVADNLHGVVVLDAVELAELLLLDVVDVRLQEDHDEDDDDDRDTLQVAVLLAMLREPRADAERDNRGHAQDLDREIIQRVSAQLQETLGRRILELVDAERLLTPSERFLGELCSAQANFRVRLQLLGDAEMAARLVDRILISLGDGLLELRRGEFERH